MGRTVKGIHLDPHRGYRERCAPRDGEHGFQLVIGETDLRVTAVSPLPEGFKDAPRGPRGPRGDRGPAMDCPRGDGPRGDAGYYDGPHRGHY